MFKEPLAHYWSILTPSNVDYDRKISRIIKKKMLLSESKLSIVSNIYTIQDSQLPTLFCAVRDISNQIIINYTY